MHTLGMETTSKDDILCNYSLGNSFKFLLSLGWYQLGVWPL